MTEAQLLQELKNNPFLLAPMAGITDRVFRWLMRLQGCGIVTSELVSANGLFYNSDKTKNLMKFFEDERPVGIQIFGEEEQALVEAAQYVEQLGADFVDINLGCPVKKVVKKGAGSAMMKEPDKLRRICRQIKSKIQIPLTIKIRTGWDQHSRNALEIVQLAFDEGVTWVAIHGRTRAQAYNGEADWDYIAGVKANSPLPIIGNGDITSPELAVGRLKESGCDGVMIGRGCLKNPWIFQQAFEQWSGTQKAPMTHQYLPLFEFIKEKGQNEFEERVIVVLLRKLAAWYSTGLPKSAEFRRSLYSARGLDTTFDAINNYYQTVDPHLLVDTSDQAFLKGGHG
ncbi:MAG: tRNA dihydrouridine synthase DusB [Pseudomonadota bacterium]